MRSVLSVLVIVFGAVLSLPVLAEPMRFLKSEVSGDFLSVGFKFNQVMEPKNFSDTIVEAANNPVVVSAIQQLGHEVGAWAPSGLSINAGQTAGGGEEERYYRVDFPAGYKFCSAQMNTVSVVPLSGERASVIAAVPYLDRLEVSAWTPRENLGGSRAWVDADFYLLLVRDGSRDGFLSQGICKQPQVLVNCRGNGTGNDGRGPCGVHKI